MSRAVVRRGVGHLWLVALALCVGCSSGASREGAGRSAEAARVVATAAPGTSPSRMSAAQAAEATQPPTTAESREQASQGVSDSASAPGKVTGEKPVSNAGAASARAGAAAADDLLLPDLRTLPPHSLRIRVNARTGRRLLRLGNTYWNGGEGDFELRGSHDLGRNRTQVVQRVPTRRGGVREFPIGEFVFHPKHNHWHFGSMALYELWSLKPDGSKDEVVASSGKITYCMLDTVRLAPDLPGTPKEEQYLKCGRRLQGMSVGWGDTYGFRLPGQHVDITRVPDGRYALHSTADPDNTVRETNDRNNIGITYVRIRGNELAVMRRPR